MTKLFITGTDTGIGKTYVTIRLLNYFKAQGRSVLGIKPVSSGCNKINNILYNDDALLLQKNSTVNLDYQDINPLAFEPPIAPHLAAQQVNATLDTRVILEKTHYALNYPVDIHLVEGVGGWYVPLNDQETMADFVIQANLKVILVVGIRLGALNHAILTYNAIKNSAVPFAGWIANCFQPPVPEMAAIIATLKQWLKVPCLSIIGYNE